MCVRTDILKSARSAIDIRGGSTFARFPLALDRQKSLVLFFLSSPKTILEIGTSLNVNTRTPPSPPPTVGNGFLAYSSLSEIDAIVLPGLMCFRICVCVLCVRTVRLPLQQFVVAAAGRNGANTTKWIGDETQR